MARYKAFDRDEVLTRAVQVFAEHGYEGTSAQMLTEAMGIGRQSIYDTFGDKWRLYLDALRLYTQASVNEQIAALTSSSNAMSALQAHLAAFVKSAVNQPACLGLSATAEFGCGQIEIVEISRNAGGALACELARCIARGQASGDIAPDLDPKEVSHFLMAQLSALKLAARAGASRAELDRVAALALRALR